MYNYKILTYGGINYKIIESLKEIIKDKDIKTIVPLDNNRLLIVLYDNDNTNVEEITREISMAVGEGNNGTS